SALVAPPGPAATGPGCALLASPEAAAVPATASPAAGADGAATWRSVPGASALPGDAAGAAGCAGCPVGCVGAGCVGAAAVDASPFAPAGASGWTGIVSTVRPGAPEPVAPPSSTRDHSAPRPKYMAIAITPSTASRIQVSLLPDPPLSKPSAPRLGMGASSDADGRSSDARSAPPTEATNGSTSASKALP